MNIKQALKEKNKLVKKNSENFQKFSTYNSVEEGSVRPYDPRKSLEDWMKGVDQLVELKTKIHKANSKVYDKIFKLAELKSMAKQLRNVDCESGKVFIKYGSDSIIKVTEISILERDQMIEKIESEIETIQDELDIHNAKQKINE